MRSDRVRDNETLSALSARLGVPGCMLLRANRLFSPAWLLPGREISVPEGDFCLTDDFSCLAQAVCRKACLRERTVIALPGDDLAALAARYRADAATVERLNPRRGPLLPGMAIKILERT